MIHAIFYLKNVTSILLSMHFIYLLALFTYNNTNKNDKYKGSITVKHNNKMQTFDS